MICFNRLRTSTKLMADIRLQNYLRKFKCSHQNTVTNNLQAWKMAKQRIQSCTLYGGSSIYILICVCCVVYVLKYKKNGAFRYTNSITAKTQAYKF